ncbi:PREDICTED: scavenger receptor cysteine-rich type 1 protein M130-like isoform X1 [Poecilia mexicana]|uniref:SRCR domain-containing protein n=1 Tax=Poecilia mexicana TaxID=48701 RepID=A0A3B3XVW8_9TELE|nr:PREDICTED: scavenger receptor cysteine-rich type 1 protein M130-like isoform X1 [Poecilia mexicana]XP_016517115.1 PREDICTED: scavenger receptor cysteine-rich type 1 protein M130-like isoform X1 [Poecilia formosa]
MKAGNTDRQKPTSSFQSLLLNMDHTLMALLLWLCCSGVHADETHSLKESIRLVGGSRRCDGQWELNLGEWRPVHIEGFYDGLKEASVICRQLDCGSAVSARDHEPSFLIPVWTVSSECLLSGSDLKDCAIKEEAFGSAWFTCSESVRLVNRGDGCSGRLEVKVSQSSQFNQSWSSVCEADFDHQDAEVVCREFNCGSPKVLKGGLYGEVEAPMWSPQFQCGGNESSLLDCRRSDSARNSCSPGKAVGLTCSEPLRLVGGPSPCEGRLQIRHEGKWRLGILWSLKSWTLNHTEIICKWLGCGSAVSMERNTETFQQEMSRIYPYCIERVPSARECMFYTEYSTEAIKLKCLGESNSDTSSLTGSQVLLSNMKVNMKDENSSGVRNQPERIRLIEEHNRFLKQPLKVRFNFPSGQQSVSAK